MFDDILRSGFEAMGLELDNTALERYREYCRYLLEINQVMNLTAITRSDEVATLHFLDSVSLLKLADFSGKKVLDVGTGAGFPGLALKIAQPDISLTLLDSLDKRVGFLRSCCEKLGLDDVRCVHARAEEAPPQFRGAFDIVTSRAVARMSLLSELCLPSVKKGGAFIAMKGTDCAIELREAGSAIAVLGGRLERKVDYLIPGSEVSHSALIIRKEKETSAKYPRRWAQMKKNPL